MSTTPNYSFYRNPRFSANQLADYLATDNAEQRERIIRQAKFPKKIPVATYAPSKRAMASFLTSNTGALSYFDSHIRTFETRRQREPDGWLRDEMQRNIDALAAFKRVFAGRRMRRYRFVTGPTDLTLTLRGVRINTRLDVGVSDTDASGVTYSGGCVLFVANTDQARRNIEARCRSVAALVHWSLESSNPNIEPLPRLCMSLDVFGEALTKAPTATDRLRGRVASTCDEAASRWDRVAPPDDYDGPNWQ